MTRQDFYSKYFPYAVKAANRLGETPEEILSRWYWETGSDKNITKQWNNLAGIKYTKYADYKAGNGMYAGYNSLDSFVNDYVRIMKLPYYAQILEANKTPGFEDDVRAHNSSPYSEDDYNVTTIIDNIKYFMSLGGKATSTVEVNPADLQPINGITGAVIVTGLTALALLAIPRR